MTSPSERREAFQALGGLQTVVLGAVYLLVALAAHLAILVFAGSASRENGSALQLEKSVMHLQVLLRGLNEVIVTQGSKGSREIVSNATRDFESLRAPIAASEGAELFAGWPEVQGRIAKLAGDNVKIDDDALISLGKTSAGIEKLAAAASARAEAQRSRAADADRRSYIVTVVAAALVLLGTLAIFMAFHRNVTRPVEDAIDVARQVASGDLTVREASQRRGQAGRLLQTLRDMSEHLGALVGDVRRGTDAIDRAAGQLAGGNEQLSERTQRQATSLEETAASMEQLTAVVATNASSARLATEKAALARETAAKGGDVVGRFLGKMESIQAGSRRMSEIIGVIDGIAFQTNILALNAAVEAARAGEQGRGFAVVAAEVRALAQRTATAAREIKTLIEDSSSQVGEGSEMVESSRAIMHQIETAIDEVSRLVLAISQASTEQTTGIKQASVALVQMEQSVQENGALVERTAAASQALKAQAVTLKRAVSVFKLELRDEAPAGPAPAATTHLARSAPRHREAAAAPSRRLAPAPGAGEGEWREF